MPRLAARAKPGPCHPPRWFTPEFPLLTLLKSASQRRRPDVAAPTSRSRPSTEPSVAAPCPLTETQELGGCLGSPLA